MNKHLLNIAIAFIITVGLLQLSACKKDSFKAETVIASFIIDSTDFNHPVFTATSTAKTPDLDVYFYWSSGESADYIEYSQDSIFTPTYEYPGDYYISLTTTTAQGVSNTKTIKYIVYDIATELTDNPYLKNLCIGLDTTFKSWQLSNLDGHMAIGPSAGVEIGIGPDFANDPIEITTKYPKDYLIKNSLSCDSAYLNVMSFNLYYSIYRNVGPTTQWIVNWSFANSEFGYNQPEGEDVCINISTGVIGLDTAGYFSLNEKDDGTVFIEFPNNNGVPNKNFMLYYEGKPSKTKYQVLALYSDLMVIRKPRYGADGKAIGYRILKYVPEGSTFTTLPDRPLSAINPPFE